jgi:hypothetical protein
VKLFLVVDDCSTLPIRASVTLVSVNEKLAGGSDRPLTFQAPTFAMKHCGASLIASRGQRGCDW